MEGHIFHKLTLSLPSKKTAEIFAAELEPLCGAISLFEEEEKTDCWLLEGYCDELPAPDGLADLLEKTSQKAGILVPTLHCAPLPSVNWLAQNRKNFQPMRIGRFFIYPSHYKGEMPASCLPLKLDAATAFGTGEHATTQGCLWALQDLTKHFRPNRILDVGCGTGILAMASAQLWPTAHIIATDIDTEAVRVTRHNLISNRLSRHIRTAHGNGLRHSTVQQAELHDVIIANILCKPLCQMARDIANQCAFRGFVVLSGLLETQERTILSIYRGQGFSFVRRCRLQGWSTLSLQKG